MRRAVCGYRPAAPPPVFATASRSVDPERYVESVRAYFLCLPDGIAFPSDEAFRAELVSRNMYRFRHREALLERLENDGRKERVPLSSFTVDHIMPQGERLPESWKAELGPDWAQTWQGLRHTLARDGEDAGFPQARWLAPTGILPIASRADPGDCLPGPWWCSLYRSGRPHVLHNFMWPLGRPI